MHKSNIDLERLKATPNVMGVLTPSPTELQIVLGPGFVNNVTQAFGKLVNIERSEYSEGANPSSEFISAVDAAKQVKGELKQKQNYIQVFFTKFLKIFLPMIIGFIGVGILSGVAGIMQSSYGGVMDAAHAPASALSWFNALGLILNIWKNAFIIIVEWRTYEVFGGSGVLGAMTAAIYSPSFFSLVVPMFIVNNGDQTVNFLGIHINDPFNNWLTVGYRPVINDKGLFRIWILPIRKYLRDLINHNRCVMNWKRSSEIHARSFRHRGNINNYFICTIVIKCVLNCSSFGISIWSSCFILCSPIYQSI
ncbi:hypothetical protein P344_02190 [Spiroplasma mirum ATCC 29335]|uniref:PTS EIIB type-1 domain-containing protein n=1 Tax=Spiroplasma mirum ATCC 29335 TaxID=838561 RepID=W6ALA6_9MOLU|nr:MULTISPECIES: hypothetical protein [Spiroplasma]AHI57786.1 hypothetical protein P344_02190 [Spiroplasma mirum ATCC 29335]